jgi:penicillin-binding protein 1C
MTIGVWVGNPDGRAQKGISGAEHAAPLLFDLFRAVEGGATRLPQRHAFGIEETQVCAASHDLPGPFCSNREMIRYLPGRTRLRRCAVHRRVFVDDDTGLLLAGDCLVTRPHRTQVLEIHSPELISWWRSQGRKVPSLPDVSPACDGIPAEEGPRIVSPSASTPYRLRGDAPERYQQIPLIARTGGGAGQLYWYQDGALVARAAPGARLFLPPGRGAHRLVLVDSAGRSDSITYTIE